MAIADGVLLQMHEIFVASTLIREEHEPSISQTLRRGVWGCLSDVQEASSEYTDWVLSNGFAFGIPRRQVPHPLCSCRFLTPEGLTLAYCTWISPQEVFSIKASNDMNACSIVLYIITERWPGAKKYRDTYEAIKQSLLESVEENKYEPRRAIKRLYPDLLPSMARNEEGSSEVSQIVADMAGEQMLIDDLFPTPSQTASQNMVSNMISSVPTAATESSITMEFQQQSGSGFDDTLFTFDNLDIINGFDIGDFDMSRTPF